jgi:hypothetical protein
MAAHDPAALPPHSVRNTPGRRANAGTSPAQGGIVAAGLRRPTNEPSVVYGRDRVRARTRDVSRRRSSSRHAWLAAFSTSRWKMPGIGACGSTSDARRRQKGRTPLPVGRSAPVTRLDLSRRVRVAMSPGDAHVPFRGSLGRASPGASSTRWSRYGIMCWWNAYRCGGAASISQHV